MRHRTLILPILGALLLQLGAPAGAQAPFRTFDWLTHRGVRTRQGANAGDFPVPQPIKGRVWVYPPTALMPAEMVADNRIYLANGDEDTNPAENPLTAPMFPADAGGNPTTWGASVPAGPPFFRRFGLKQPAGPAQWFYPPVANRTAGGWPPSDAVSDKMGDYVYAFAHTSAVLSTIKNLNLNGFSAGDDGLTELRRLPNVSGFLEQPNVPGLPGIPPGKNLYKAVDDELQADTTFARWSFGTRYPNGTFQGLRDVSNQDLQAAKRYAVYVRFPASGTLIDNGSGTLEPHPNVDYAFVRVSWGDDVNDPHSSRIFLLNYGQTGGFWMRVRSSANEDRYFPYDGVHPLTVTLYSVNFADTNDFGIRWVVPADSVRLVPEEMRGDVHAPAASAAFPPGTDPNNDPNSVQLTYFGRDETLGPRIVTTLAQAQASSVGSFAAIPFDPTQAPTAQNGGNPHIPDQSSSYRTAVFYCFEDKMTAPTRLGRLRWRYSASSTAKPFAIIDDSDPLFNPGGFANNVANPPDQAYGATFHTAVAASPPTATATWTANLPTTGPYTVSVWIPQSDPMNQWCHGAHYQMDTDQGTVDIYFNQFSAGVNGGGWQILSTNVRFAGAQPVLRLLNDSNNNGDVMAGRRTVADAVMFSGDSSTQNSVVAAPLVADVTWPSGAHRQVVYFATTGGQVWAMDAQGVGGNSLNTTCYWAYPSVSNPDPNIGRQVPDPALGFGGPQDDPNFNKDTANNVPAQGIDGDIDKTTVGGNTIYTVNQITKVPDLGAFDSSPMYVEVIQGGTRMPLIVLGNNNGRIYAFDPAGRTNQDPMVGPVGDPYPVTFATANAFGMPGTTRRDLTWPTLGRDRWLKAGGLAANGQPNSKWSLKWITDPNKTSFVASLTGVPNGVDPTGTDSVIGGATDGHVYCADLITVNKIDRMSNEAQKGAPKWLFPDKKLALGAITQPGSLTPAGQYVFTAPDKNTAGGRVYGIPNLNVQANGVPTMTWVYPLTGTPGANPNAADKLPEEEPFTAPATQAVVAGFNGGNPVVYIANRDGRVFCLDGNTTGGNEPAILFTSVTLGPTRSSAVFLNTMTPQARFPIVGGPPPAILLGLDTGDLAGFSALTGRQVWTFPDGSVGAVPLTIAPNSIIGANPPPQAFPTSSVMRPADLTPSSNFLYEGDEGNQDAGEVNGQMRAYGPITFGQVTQDEPQIRPDLAALDIRLVNLWNGGRDNPPGPFDQFPGVGYNPNPPPPPPGPKSPFFERANAKANTQAGSNVVVFEWGDNIYVAAWGAFHYNPGGGPGAATAMPNVHFRLNRANARPIDVVANLDEAYITAGGPQLHITDGAGNDLFPPAEVHAWVAKATFPLGRGNDQDPQTPGSTYQVQVTADITSGGSAGASWGPMSIGQFDPNPYVPPHTTEDYNIVGTPRNLTIANPIALTTRGKLPLANVGAGTPNNIGWTENYPPDLSSGNITELLKNGNLLSDPVTLARTGYKDMVAPIGPVGHGSSGLYLGMDNNGNRVPALFVSDRSNMYKTGQPINNARVERTELSWMFDINNPALQNTGDVMNPLPWEQFPVTVPNRSIDYPDIDRTHAQFQGGGANMANKGVTLQPAEVVGGNKVFHPLQIDLSVDVPKYQPANVNRTYFDINGGTNSVGGLGLLSPLLLSTGHDPSNPANAGLIKNIAPSAGYVGNFYVYIDSNGNGRMEGPGAPATTQQTVPSVREEVFRQMKVGLSVPPDLNLRTAEETVDLGKQPHSSGFTPTIPFAPSGIGPFSGPIFQGPWDIPNSQQFFMPFTVQSNSNVNLWNLRVAKILGDKLNGGFNINDPNQAAAYWLRLTSEQVEQSTGVGQIWERPFSFFKAQGGAGNIGLVTSLDHANSAVNFETDYTQAPYNSANFWSMVNPYVAGGIIAGWNANTQPRPTLHKPLPGDAGPTVLSVPDVPHGDPNDYLQALVNGSGLIPGRSVRPMIGMAVPLGTPAGAYSASIYTFEDYMPDQWRAWSNLYRNTVGGGQNQMDLAVNDDGLLDVQFAGAQTTPVEAIANPPFKLKVTVMESRITNGVTPGSYPQVDIRAANAPAFGANITPSAIRDLNTGNILLWWGSNRLNNAVPLPQPPPPDLPWYLAFAQLNSVPNPPSGNALDWRFEPVSGNLVSWFNQLPANSQYPAPPYVASVRNLFPSEAADFPAGTTPPVVPGIIDIDANLNRPRTERHGWPALAQDQTVANPATWVFWQGAVYKSGGPGSQSSSLDTRTFYAPLQNGQPNPPGGVPYSFLNDPNLPKFAPKPLIANGRAYLFWYGGAQGRTRLYYNMTTDLTNIGAWTRDAVLPTPGSLSSQSDPSPVYRQVPDQNGNLVPAIDLYYSGVMQNRKQAELFMTRYTIQPNGRLSVMALPRVDSELMARDGVSQTWTARDLAWVYQVALPGGNRDYVDANGIAPYNIAVIQANGNVINRVNQGAPTFDNATGRLYYNSALGGQLFVDPQAGTVTFTGVAPRNNDRVMVAYTPQSMRANVTRNDTGAEFDAAPGVLAPSYPAYPNTVPPALFTDPGYINRPLVNAPGSNTGPAAFIDRSANPRYFESINAQDPHPNVMIGANAAPPVTRLWLIYRKTDSNVTAPSALYYKTMRLMVRLPRGVALSVNGGKRDATANVTIANNKGPVEIDWIRGRLYFTEADEGNVVTVSFQAPVPGGKQAFQQVDYRVTWGDELSNAIQPGDQSNGETLLPTDASVNEGQISAFKDPFQDKVWVFWASTRNGTTDLYYLPISPQIYPIPGL